MGAFSLGSAAILCLSNRVLTTLRARNTLGEMKMDRRAAVGEVHPIV